MGKMKKMTGVYLVLATALISGGANFFNKFGMQALGKNPYQYTTLKNVVVALLLSLIVLTPVIWPKLKKLSKKDWGKLALIGVIGGSFPFLLFFKGLSMTSPVGASFIHKTLFIWVAIMAIPILKEKLTKVQWFAAAMLVGGNVAFLGIKTFAWESAYTLILIATMMWAIENVIAKITLRRVDAIVVAWGRMFLGAIVLLGFLAVTGNTAGLLSVTPMQFGWLLLAAMFLLGYVVTWYSALKRLPVTIVASFLVLASPITTILNSVFVTHQFPSQQVLGIGLIISALLLFWQFKPEKTYELETAKV